MTGVCRLSSWLQGKGDQQMRIEDRNTLCREVLDRGAHPGLLFRQGGHDTRDMVLDHETRELVIELLPTQGREQLNILQVLLAQRRQRQAGALEDGRNRVQGIQMVRLENKTE